MGRMENTSPCVGVATFTDAVEGEGRMVQGGSGVWECGGDGVWEIGEMYGAEIVAGGSCPPYVLSILNSQFSILNSQFSILN
jgi:hypothetical protein